MAPNQTLLLRIIVLNSIVVIQHPGAAHVRGGSDRRAANAAANDLRFKMIDRYIMIPPFVLSPSSSRRRSQICQWHICDSSWLTYAYVLTTAQAMMTAARKLGSIAWRFPQETRSPSESAGPDLWAGYHRRAYGSVVSKCALNVLRTKGKGSDHSKPCEIKCSAVS